MKNLNSLVVLLIIVTLSFFLGLIIKKFSFKIITNGISRPITTPILLFIGLTLSEKFIEISVFLNLIFLFVLIYAFIKVTNLLYKESYENNKNDIFNLDIDKFYFIYIITALFFLFSGLIGISKKLEIKNIRNAKINEERKFEKIFNNVSRINLDIIDTNISVSNLPVSIKSPKISIITQNEKGLCFDLNLNSTLYKIDSNYVSRFKDSTNLIVLVRNIWIKVGEYSHNTNTGGGDAIRQDRLIYLINAIDSKCFKKSVLQGYEPPSSIVVQKYSSHNGAKGEIKSDTDLCEFIILLVKNLNSTD